LNDTKPKPASPNYGALSGSTNFCGFSNVWSGPTLRLQQRCTFEGTLEP
jgi:hypothetical protein